MSQAVNLKSNSIKVKIIGMKSKNICVYLVSLLVFSFSPAWATPEDELLIERATQIAKENPGFMLDLILENISEFKSNAKNSQSNETQKKHLISEFVEEAEKDIVVNKLAALKKIKFVLDAANVWSGHLNARNRYVLNDEGRALLMRWLLEKNQIDQNLAAEKYQLLDEISNTKDKGFGVYMHGATYETLASIARSLELPREEQIDLIKKGIQINLMGQKKYPNYSYGVSLDALFGKFQFFTGGVSVYEYIEEWISFVKTKPLVDQGISGSSIAGALFTIGRDEEAIEWADIYIQYFKKLLSSPNLNAVRKSQIDQACDALGGFNFEFRALATRNPILLDTLNKKLCSALSELK